MLLTNIVVHPASGKDITLHELQTSVHGCIEIVHDRDDIALNGQEWRSAALNDGAIWETDLGR
jgi:hypothetical protein